MNRNTQEKFALNPINIDIQRSRFIMNPEVKTSFNLGDIAIIGKPIEILPGDTFEINAAMAIRMMPLATSPFGNLTFSLYYFFVPNRLLWDHWKEFMGENTESEWIPQTKYTVPQLQLHHGAQPKSIMDYLSVPIIENDEDNNWLDVSALYARGYALIYNEWFRNENVIPPVMVHTDDTDRKGITPLDNNWNDPVIATELGGPLLKASKRPDLFVKSLPGPQKGPDLTIMDHMPVYVDPDRIRDASEVVSEHPISNLAFTVPTNNDPNLGTYANRSLTWNSVGGSPYVNIHDSQPNNWYVDGNLTISALRTAFQIQKLYEKDARGGTRYREMLKAHFGVTSPDASQQVPQYLGGRDIPININSVVQTSESANTPQGNIAGYSITANATRKPDIIQSFTEHGLLYILGVCRVDQHVYQQGLHRSFTRKNRTDYYFPVLANISEFPVLNEEIYATGYKVGTLDESEKIYTTDKEVFGYQEAWYDYRFTPSVCTGSMRSNVTGSLDKWHFADDYDSLPHLSQSWLEEDKSILDRSLAVNSEVADQFFGDFAFDIKATRPMPMYSIPGLVDHH